jgi:hypothetical protein
MAKIMNKQKKVEQHRKKREKARKKQKHYFQSGHYIDNARQKVIRENHEREREALMALFAGQFNV